MRRSLPAQLSLLLLSGLIPCLLANLGSTMPPGDTEEARFSGKVEQWIKDLGSDSFEKREAAARALINMEEEPPGLRKMLKSPDLEIRRRVANILDERQRNRVERGLRRACLLAKEGRADEMVERLVLQREWIKEEKEWRVVAEFAVALVEWEHRTFGNTRFLKSGFWPNVPSAFRGKHLSPKDTATPEELARMWTRVPHRLGQEITLKSREVSGMHLVILASENVKTPCLDMSVLVAAGSVHMQFAANHSVIICDDDLEVSSGFGNCLVFVRGKVTCNKSSKITDSTILCGGPVVFSEGARIENSAIFTGCPITCPKGITVGKTSVLREGMPHSPVKFFGPEVVGLTVWQAYHNPKYGKLPAAEPIVAFPDNFIEDLRAHPDLGAGVQIKEMRKGTPFGASLREGDIITAIDGKKTTTKELFRKVLRRELAEGGPLMTLTVRRSDKTLEVRVPMKD
jgi:hypothetical protein